MNRRVTAAASLLLLGVLAGCVSPSTYNQTLRELQSARSDFDRARAQNEGLNKQMIGLKESLGTLEAELKKAHAKHAALNDGLAKERHASDGKLKDLERQLREVMDSKQALSQELETAQQRYENSLKIQKRQAKELKEREQLSLTQPPTQPVSPSAPQLPTPPLPPKPESTPPAAR